MLFPVLWSTLKINLWVLLLIRSNDPVDAESNPGPVLIAACSTFVKNYQGDCTVSATYTTKYADIYIPEQYHVQHIRTHKRFCRKMVCHVLPILPHIIPRTWHYKLMVFHMSRIVPTHAKDETYNGSGRLNWNCYVCGHGEGSRGFTPM